MSNPQITAELASKMEARVKTVAEDSSVTAAEQAARKALVEALLICIRYADSSADTEQAHAALALAAKLPGRKQT